MNIDELTPGQVKALQSLGETAQETFQPYAIGEAYLIRTVTHIDIGVVTGVGPTELVLTDVSWVADTGRYANAFSEGTLSEVEPYPDGQEVIIGRGSIIDATQWKHPLPRKQV